MKYFIITIDTEGDDLWDWHEGMPLTTHNVEYLPCFQKLCDKYGFKPTWLVNWEILNDRRFVEFAKGWMSEDRCEVGMHLHAWNTPPYYELPRNTNSGLPYLIEYPDDTMEAKIVSMTEKYIEVFGKQPKTHRAGRWGMDSRYFKLLYKHGYRVDCSVTPYVSWEKSAGQTPGSAGSDYSKEKSRISYREGIFEVPMSTMSSRKRFTAAARNKQKDNPDEFPPRVFWLRPMGNNLKSMMYLIDSRSLSKSDYLEFMIHSSELMPGGSPTFRTEGDIETLYAHLETIFERIARKYKGVGLEEYWCIKTQTRPQ